MHEELLLLSEENVRELLSVEDAIAAAEETFYRIGTGDITVGNMSLMFTDETRKNNFHSMPAVLHFKHVAGVKWISTFSAPLPGYTFCHGTSILLSDTNTGSPIALVGGTSITAMRTAGGHGVVQAKHLTNPDPETLTVMGCGLQARAGIRGFLTQFPSIRQVRIYNRSRAPMEEVQRQYAGRAEVVICDTPAQAVEGCRLILMASGAREPLLKVDMVKPGTTVIGIEGFRDIEPTLCQTADKWYLGYGRPDQDIINSTHLNPTGFVKNDYVFGDMTELLTGKVPGRESEDEIIVSTHMGMGAHDVNCAEIVYRRALEKGIGQRFVMEG